MLATLLCSTLLFNGCKKDKNDPVEPAPVEDEITTLVRAYAAQRTLVTQLKDPKFAPVEISYADYTYKDSNGKDVKIIGKGRFTLEKARALASLIPELINLNESTSPVTIQWYNRYETFNGFYQIGLLLSCSPPPSGNPNYAMVDVSEVVIEPEGARSFLTKFAFTVPKP